MGRTELVRFAFSVDRSMAVNGGQSASTSVNHSTSTFFNRIGIAHLPIILASL
jgi:hypothetical protein